MSELEELRLKVQFADYVIQRHEAENDRLRQALGALVERSEVASKHIWETTEMCSECCEVFTVLDEATEQARALLVSGDGEVNDGR